MDVTSMTMSLAAAATTVCSLMAGSLAESLVELEMRTPTRKKSQGQVQLVSSDHRPLFSVRMDGERVMRRG
jgi:hypothetical protein